MKAVVLIFPDVAVSEAPRLIDQVGDSGAGCEIAFTAGPAQLEH